MKLKYKDKLWQIYPMTRESISFREGQMIKRVTDLTVDEVGPALARGDSDVFLAALLVSMRRAGEVVDIEQLLDEKMAVIELVEEEGDAVPPDEAVGDSETSTPTEPDDPGTPSSSKSASAD